MGGGSQLNMFWCRGRVSLLKIIEITNALFFPEVVEVVLFFRSRGELQHINRYCMRREGSNASGRIGFIS